MEVVTESAPVKKAQDGVLEFLLVNHPLDCPVCDKGGECPLQDQTIAYGPGETRFVEEKRHWDKPVPLSPLVLIDRERCIQCARCTRFAEEVAGDAGIDFASRSDSTEVAIYPGQPFVSNFSGNVVQICPVGRPAGQALPFQGPALGPRAGREHVHVSAPSGAGSRCSPAPSRWCVSSGSTATRSTGVGCATRAGSASRRSTAPSGSPGPWCAGRPRDRARARRTTGRAGPPGWRRPPGAKLWPRSPARVGGVPGRQDRRPGRGAPGQRGRLRLGQVGPHGPAHRQRRRPARRRAAGRPDRRPAAGDDRPGLRRAPDRHHRARHQGGAARPLLAAAPRRRREGRADHRDKPGPTGLSPRAPECLRYRPGELPDLVEALCGEHPVTGEVAGIPAEQAERARAAIAAATRGPARRPERCGRPRRARASPSCSAGRRWPSRATGPAEAARLLAGLPGVSFLPALRRSNVHGAIDLGLCPGRPARTGRPGARAAAGTRTTGGRALPRRPASTPWACSTEPRPGEIDVLFLLGADPLSDCPDQDLAAQGAGGARFVVAIDAFRTPSVAPGRRRAPGRHLHRTAWQLHQHRRPGHLARAKGDRPGLGPAGLDDRRPAGVSGSAPASAPAPWRSSGPRSKPLSPLHRGVPQALLVSRQGRNGVVVPLGLEAPSPEPPRCRPPLDPMADPGIASAELHPPLRRAARSPAEWAHQRTGPARGPQPKAVPPPARVRRGAARAGGLACRPGGLARPGRAAPSPIRRRPHGAEPGRGNGAPCAWWPAARCGTAGCSCSGRPPWPACTRPSPSGSTRTTWPASATGGRRGHG